ncbi:hypothetical protein CNMCM6805_002395 [Aspergillus fumigatiaffinis]|uniref:N,O-diacetylmuramidase n=1 Tax=Aspergillus fumigatiaffinis TaxID=340414 RepID=A0A8H4HE01_9EURO|nr:hypothetical protein CNMCM6457_006398 [Aspergillus fumigatiaffinis]KAF4242771.1 hypothetical protein CNMCM6805_002395 [Aspergillus fumigatiaffinis]
MAPRLTRMQDCGWTSADVPEIKDKNASVTLRDSVDLSLSYSPEKLLSVFISEYQPSLGLQPGIITLLNASWLVTVRCFCPVQDIHLGRRSPGVYFITRLGQAAGHQVAIELNSEAPVKNLVRDVSLLQSGALSQMAVGDEPSDEASDKFLTTTICYAEGKLSAMGEGSSNGNLNAGVVNRQHINSKLFLGISQANGELQAKLTFSVSDISRDLALTLRHAQLTPDAPAVHSWDGDLTYAQLDDATSRLGQFLASMGVGRGTYVISCFEKSTWAIVARLAILKAGAAYISVDATDPPIYLENVIRRVNAKIILTSEAYQPRYAPCVPSVIAVTPEMVCALPVSTGIICPLVKPSDACLILFTSGSTGEPKGIIQEHRAYATAVRDYNKLLGIGRHSRVLQFDDYAFDISNNDYLTTLTAGGCCCVHTPTKSVSTLVKDINTLQVNMTFLTPTIAAQISPQDVPTLELVCLGGEPMSNELLMRWSPHVRLVNQYGMGEAATFCAYNDQLKPGQNAIVGRAGSGAIWITSPESPELLMPVGAVGEILIEGPHLARGYLDGVCQKAGVGFLPHAPAWLKDLHPSRAATSRFYRSGDLGRYTHVGTVEHLGRKDTLLKINGYRVEATEVEYILRRSLSPGDVVIVDLLGEIDGPREPFLVAFLWLTNREDHFRPAASNNSADFLPVTSHHSAHKLVQRMKAEVMATLPVHKIPEYFILVSQIPRTRSNKTDRRKLHHLAQKSYLSGVLTATQNGTEGIDLFEVHLPVDWKDAVANGVKFVFVKATEGINYRNLRFPTQTAGALAAGIVHGAVHFASAAESSGADQADLFIEHGGNWTADGQTLPGVLEMEGNIAGKLYKVRTGRAPILFLSAGWWAKCAGNNATFGAEHALWLANWAEEMGTLPAGWEEAMFWQYAGFSENGGEANVFFGSSKDLVTFAIGADE